MTTCEAGRPTCDLCAGRAGLVVRRERVPGEAARQGTRPLSARPAAGRKAHRMPAVERLVQSQDLVLWRLIT